ncbi:ubiquitin carboxyl-terminal hydrolase MINDY-1 isoform X1 [Olea europaea var. sylvestris]|uniref:ubiquitin carboxyl-terminal hydrolase MINDY-1 isoform X1 n=1 Tax=Olea europaea var. sylvestris TaxID=158386 RepID=UPI000C1D77AE|nr:ubiquitin carboxyl-terminal hydrolase MINDY-1 isoform X1 [Olea europaea var. sylvestris]
MNLMDSSPPPPSDSSSSLPSTAAPPAEQKQEERVKEMVHKTKVIQFLGRTTPIILQNDNGPCPLLAICNVLLLKNSLNLSPDIAEVSQEKLLSLIADRLFDSNSNINDKDAGYAENQQQNIADAIDLLPRLTTGIDVNIKFTRIDDFEFTRECAIFDLLDIPLYHGWIVDPQDYETMDVIGSKSYNTLMGELVSLEAQTMKNEYKQNLVDDSVDFVAATTAALGVPSPSLSRGRSFDDSACSDSPHLRARKGDIEEEVELLIALKLSEAAMPKSSADNVPNDEFMSFTESACNKKSELVVCPETVEEVVDQTVNTLEHGTLKCVESNALSYRNNDATFPETVTEEDTLTQSNCVLPTSEESKENCKNVVEKTGSEMHVENEHVQPVSSEQDPAIAIDSVVFKSTRNEHVHNEVTSTSDADVSRNHHNSCETRDSSELLTSPADLNPLSSQIRKTDDPETFKSGIGSEPIYEGEESILESGTTIYEDREPVYEGEVILSGHVDKRSINDGDQTCKDIMTAKQGELIRNFLRNSASQLTIYGLFCLKDKVKERELCVFFRNNHFNTMFKYEGELYILAADQGYITQPDLVWEKLNEVNGDTLFMTGNFKEFKVEDHSNSTWHEQNAVESTADYLPSIDGGSQENLTFYSDLQLAMALQQQEFEQQQPQRSSQQQQPQHNAQQPAIAGGSRLMTGPPVPSSTKYTSSSSKQDPKPLKDKCNVM